ncbi:MAG: hypothetical protein N3Z29_07535 [Synechococcaceae cyanobacterium MAG-AL1]|nr:hypothetical protein [Candidatus Regnicoccus frigidus MAG-AL1]
MTPPDAKVRLDLNNPVFQEHLLTLQILKRQKPERHAALDTLNKIRQLTWNQLYRDSGINAVYSLRISPSRRATAHRDGHVLRLLTIAPDHDATDGKK